VLGDLPSNEQLASVAGECSRIQRGLETPGFVPQVYHRPCDVSVESQVESLVQVAVSELGGIDVVCLLLQLLPVGLQATRPIDGSQCGDIQSCSIA
jgi:NAD(P)-dependent dehydrogenase (short-subunit alcohol dehydrogenase family)